MFIKFDFGRTMCRKLKCGKLSILLVLFAVVAAVVTGCSFEGRVNEVGAMEKVDLITDDGVNIAGDYYRGNQYGFILLHMLSRNRNDYRKLAEILNKRGYSVLVIDLRGHGESGLDHHDFSEEDFNNMVEDVRAAAAFLVDKGADKLSIIGASIGANTALNYAASDEMVVSVVMLSPGLNYKGIKTEDSVGRFKGSLLIVAASGDQYSAESSIRLNELAGTSRKEFKTLEGARHGTNMLDEELINYIVGWVERN